MTTNDRTPLLSAINVTHPIEYDNSNLTVETLYEHQDDKRLDEDIDPENYEFAGWGTISRIDLTHKSAQDLSIRDNDDLNHKSPSSKPHVKLGVFRATSIAGNDITSSCLYVAGIGAQSARKFTPISLLLVVIVLYFFRSIYSEVGEALPLNGGSYNVLLNSTSKLVAAFAACLSIISYVATAVVSAASATSYLGDMYLPLACTKKKTKNEFIF